MARIRTIKPEFPQSESMGRVSRDARLCFIMIWTICDDAGRVRGSSRMLASLLYPYDDDAPKLIEGWLCELEQEGCIRRYKVGTDTYLESCNWLKHQKIDKASASRLPAFDEGSRIVSKPLEVSPPYLVPSTVDLVPSTVDLVPSTDARSASADDTKSIDAAFQAYNEVATELGWPEAQRVSNTRKAKMRARLKDCGGLDGWREAMSRARGSPYLRGETKRSAGYENWTPDIDFLLQESSFTKLMEGKYDQRDSNTNQSSQPAFALGASAFFDGVRTP